MRLALLAVAMVIAGTAHAEWKPEYGHADAATRQWYATRQTTAATRERLNAAWYRFCCDHADTVEAKFRHTVDPVTFADVWLYQRDAGAWHIIPADTVQDGETPTGEPILFIDQIRNYGPVCFFPGKGGI